MAPHWQLNTVGSAEALPALLSYHIHELHTSLMNTLTNMMIKDIAGEIGRQLVHRERRQRGIAVQATQSVQP